MRMPELKSLARDRGLRTFFSRMRKTELIALLQNNGTPEDPRAPTPRTRPPPPPPPTRTWEPIDDRRSRKPSPQEMDIFKQQEISKSQPHVKSKLNKWYSWLMNHVPKRIKDGASKAFKTFKDKVMGLYNRVTGSAGNEMRIKGPEPFKPIELEQAFGGAIPMKLINTLHLVGVFMEKFAYGDIDNPLRLYRGKDCIKTFCNYIKGEAHRLYHMFPELPMDPLTKKQWKKHK